MTIHVHIERLVLEGIDLPQGERPWLQTAVETELTNLLLNGGLAPALQTGGAYRSIQAQTIHLQSSSAPALGQQIAQAVYGGIGP